MKKLIKKKNILIITLVFAVCIMASVTYSFYTDNESIQNNMLLGYSEAKIYEEFEDNEKDVWVENIGTTPLLVRINAKMICTNGDIALDASKIAEATYPNPTEWIDGGDGWYYYNKILPSNIPPQDPPQNRTSQFIHIETNVENVPEDEEHMYEGAQLDVPVNLEYYLPLMVTEGGKDIYTHEKAWGITSDSPVYEMLRKLVNSDYNEGE